MEKTRFYLIFLTLLFWGGVILRIWVSGELVDYLHPDFHSLVICTGVGLVFLAGAWYWANDGGRREDHNGCCSGCGGGGQKLTRNTRDAISCLFLLLALGGAVFASGGKYNVVHLINRQVVTTPDQVPSLQEQGRVLEVEQLIGAGEEGGDAGLDLLLLAAGKDQWRRELEGRTVSTLGQVRKEGDQSHIVRLLAVCCAADARPLGISIPSEALHEFSTGDWVVASGQLRFSGDTRGFSPYIDEVKLTKAKTPKRAILY